MKASSSKSRNVRVGITQSTSQEKNVKDIWQLYHDTNYVVDANKQNQKWLWMFAHPDDDSFVTELKECNVEGVSERISKCQENVKVVKFEENTDKRTIIKAMTVLNSLMAGLAEERQA